MPVSPRIFGVFGHFQNLNLLALREDLRGGRTARQAWSSGSLLCPVAHGLPHGTEVRELRYLGQAADLPDGCEFAARHLGTTRRPCCASSAPGTKGRSAATRCCVRSKRFGRSAWRTPRRCKKCCRASSMESNAIRVTRLCPALGRTAPPESGAPTGQCQSNVPGSNPHHRLAYSFPRIVPFSTCTSRSSIFLWALSTSLSVSVRSSA